MRTFTILLILSLGATPCSAQDFKALAAGILALHSGGNPAPAPAPQPQPGPAPTPTPNPAPALITCPNCRGKGKVGDGTVMVTCAKCGGSGKVPAASVPPTAPQKTIRYQCIQTPQGRVCVPVP